MKTDCYHWLNSTYTRGDYYSLRFGQPPFLEWVFFIRFSARSSLSVFGYREGMFGSPWASVG